MPKRGTTHSVTPKTRPRAQNVKTGPKASVTPKTRPGAHNVKTRPDALGNAENAPGRAKHEHWDNALDNAENRARRNRYRQKYFRERKTRIRGPTHSVTRKTRPRVQNANTGPDALGNAEMRSGGQNAKTGPTYSVTPKKRPAAQNAKTWLDTGLNVKAGPNAFGDVECVREH